MPEQTALATVVQYAHDMHLSRHHPDASSWDCYDGCAFCVKITAARDAAGIGQHTRRVTLASSLAHAAGD